MTASASKQLRTDVRRMSDQTDALREDAAAIFAVTTSEQWTWSPDANTWSMALVVEHLNTVLRLSLPPLKGAVERLRAEGGRSDAIPKYSLLERLFIRVVSPNPPFKSPVPPIFLPQKPADPSGVTGPMFIADLEQLATIVRAADGLDLRRIKVASPASDKMRLTLGTWLEATVMHNAYHWEQVRALRANAKFPKS